MSTREGLALSQDAQFTDEMIESLPSEAKL